MDRPRLDYNLLAPTYDARYAVRRLDGIASALRDLVARRRPRRVLEVGCGTGRWLEELAPHVHSIYGLDPAAAMLQRALKRTASGIVLAARANALPLRRGTFDLIFCVNAIHHFDDPAAFVEHAKERLVETGALSIVGIDPRLIHKWYLYEYFDGTYERDLLRYPSVGDLVNWMAEAGFARVDYRVVEVSGMSWTNESVLADPFLKKDSNSMLALLSDREYAAGLRRIEAALDAAAAEQRNVVFETELPFLMITGSAES